MALTMRLLVDGGAPIAGGIIGGGADELRWPRPVRPGDELPVESEVLEIRPSRSRPQQGMMKMRTTTFNQNGEPVQTLVANLVVPRPRPRAYLISSSAMNPGCSATAAWLACGITTTVTRSPSARL